MQNLLVSLCQLLEEKCRILDELNRKQEGFKAFLIKPRWNRYVELIKPQEVLVAKLQQSQAHQRRILDSLAPSFGVRGIPSLGVLCSLVAADWRKRFKPLINQIKEATEILKKGAAITQRLNQAHGRFLQRLVGKTRQAQPNTGVYNAQGLTQGWSFDSRIYREA